jgi:hypothetical protein
VAYRIDETPRKSSRSGHDVFFFFLGDLFSLVNRIPRDLDEGHPIPCGPVGRSVRDAPGVDRIEVHVDEDERAESDTGVHLEVLGLEVERLDDGLACGSDAGRARVVVEATVRGEGVDQLVDLWVRPLRCGVFDRTCREIQRR